MIKLSVFTVFLFAVFNVSSQNLEWASHVSGIQESVVYETEVDGNGSVYLVGTFIGTADFDPGSGNFFLTSAGGQDVFIQKLDQNGDFVWAKSVGGEFDDQSYSIDLSGDSALVIGGYFSDTADFDPGPNVYNLTFSGTDNSQEEAFILKLDNDGNLLWAKSFGGEEDELVYEIKVDDSGDIYTTGNFHATIDGDPGIGVTTVPILFNHAVFIQKLDSQGDLIWIKTMDGNASSLGKDLLITALGEVIVTGQFSGYIDVDPGVSNSLVFSGGGNDVFLVKLDANGDYMWAKTFGGSTSESVNDIASNSMGEIYLTGRFEQTVDFDPGTNEELRTSAGDNDVYVLKVDENGDFVWVNSFGGGSDNQGFTLAVNSVDDVLAAGFYRATMDVDPGPGVFEISSEGNMDCFIVKFKNNGDFVGAQSYGGSSWDYCYSISIDANDKLYMSGLFYGTIDFDPDVNTEFLVTSGGDYDGYVIKIGSIELSLEDAQLNSLSVHPNPMSDQFTIDLGDIATDAHVEIIDALGRSVFQREYTNKRVIDISFDSHPSGIYYVKVESDDSIRTVKMIKE